MTSDETRPAATEPQLTDGGAPAPPPDPILTIASTLALAEAMKPLEGPIGDVYSQAPDKVEARKKAKDAYDVAAGAGGPLRVRFEVAKRSFDRAVFEMIRNELLKKWLDTAFAPSGSLKTLLEDRKSLMSKFKEANGELQVKRAAAAADSKKWAARYADWSAPVERLTAQIGRYGDKIDKLNTDIANDVNRNAAMTAFWFEVAPLHLPLESAFTDEVAHAVDEVSHKIGDYEDIKDLLKIGPKPEYDLTLVDTGDAAKTRREAALVGWTEAAKAQAEAEAAFRLAPDDFATLKARWDKLKDDGWIALAKKLP